MYTFYIKNYVDDYGTFHDQETTVYSVPIEVPNAAFIDPEIRNELGKAGTMEYSVQPNHLFYNAWKKMKTILRAEYDGDTIFRGRVLTVETPNMQGEKKIHCEGDLAFLLDSQQEGVKEDNRQATTALAYLASVINTHNSQMSGEPDKQFTLGEVPGQYTEATDPSQRVVTDSRKYGSSSWQSTMSALEALQKQFGGYFRTRYQNGTCYLDWLKNYYNAAVNGQPIELGENLIDISSSTESEDIFTVLIPIGSSSGNNSGEPVYLPGLRLPVPDILNYYTDEELNLGYRNKEDFANAIEDHGTIIKPENFSNADTVEKLREYALDYILNNYTGGDPSFTVSALDMHHIDGQAQKYLIGDRIPVIYPDAKGHNRKRATLVRKVLTATEVTYHPHNPDSNEYIIGVPNSGMSKEYGTANKNTRSSGISGIGSISLPSIEELTKDLEKKEDIETKKKVQNLDAAAWEYLLSKKYNKAAYESTPEYQEMIKNNPDAEAKYGMLQVAQIFIKSDLEDPNNFRYNRAILGGKTEAITVLPDLTGLDLSDKATIERIVAEIPEAQKAIRALVIDCYENQLTVQERIDRDASGTLRWFKDIELALDNPGANPDAINDIHALNSGTLTFEEFLNRHPIEDSSKPKTTFKLNGNTGTVFNFTSVLGGATNADGLFSPITLDGLTGTVSIGSSLESLLGSDGTVTAQSLISAVPGLSGQIDANGTITSVGKALLEKKFPGISKLISGATTVAKIGDAVSKVKSGAAQLVGNLVPLSGLGNTVNEIKKNLTNLIPGLNSEIDANGNITTAGQELISGKVAELGGENTTFSSLLDILGLKKSQPGATVALDGTTGTQKIGKDDNGDWNITLNEPITYTDSSGVTRTLTGAVRAKDFSLQEVPSFKTKFASIDTLLANAIYTNTLDAAVAHAGYLKTENLEAEVADIGLLKASDLESETAKVGVIRVGGLIVTGTNGNTGVVISPTISATQTLRIGSSGEEQGSETGDFYFQGMEYDRKRVYMGQANNYLFLGNFLGNAVGTDLSLNHAHAVTMQEITSGANAGKVQATIGNPVAVDSSERIDFFDIAASQTFLNGVAAAKTIDTNATIALSASDFGQTVTKSVSVTNGYDDTSIFLAFDISVPAAPEGAAATLEALYSDEDAAHEIAVGATGRILYVPLKYRLSTDENASWWTSRISVDASLAYAAGQNAVSITGPTWSQPATNAQATFSTNAPTPNTKQLGLYLTKAGLTVQLRSDSASGDIRAYTSVEAPKLYHTDVAPDGTESGPYEWTSTINGNQVPGYTIKIKAANSGWSGTERSIVIPDAVSQRSVDSLSGVTLSALEINTSSHTITAAYSDGTTSSVPINVNAYNVYTAGKNYIMENWGLSLGRYRNGSSSLSYTALSNDGNNAIELDYGEYAFAAIMLDGTARKFGAIKAPDQPRHTYYDTRQMYYISERTGQYVPAGNANTVWYYETGTA